MNFIEMIMKYPPKRTFGDKVVSVLVIVVLVSVLILACIGVYHLVTVTFN